MARGVSLLLCRLSQLSRSWALEGHVAEAALERALAGGDELVLSGGGSYIGSPHLLSLRCFPWSARHEGEWGQVTSSDLEGERLLSWLLVLLAHLGPGHDRAARILGDPVQVPVARAYRRWQEHSRFASPIRLSLTS